MNVQTPQKQAGTELAIATAITPAIFMNPDGVDSVLAELERTVEAAKATRDISTVEGRAAIASLAYKIARTKTGLDEMGKDVVADWKAKANMVDSERRRIRERCDALKDDFRAPLTEWEETEKRRVAEHEAQLARLQMFAVFSTVSPRWVDVRDRVQLLEDAYTGRDWQEFYSRASLARDGTLMRLQRLIEDRFDADHAAAGLEHEQREQQERDRQAREARIAEEAAARARAEIARQAAEEQQRRDREAQEKIDAERRERQAAEQRALEAQEKALRESREQEERLAAAEQRAQDAAAEATRKIEAQQAAAAEEQRRREENRRIRARVNNLVAVALVREVLAIGDGMPATLTDELAKAVVVAIASKKIPHVSITY